MNKRSDSDSFNSKRGVIQKIGIACICILMLSIAVINAAEYYVDTKGSNDNTGDKEHPFATLQKALDLVKPGDTIFLNPGKYFQNGNTKTHGEKEHPISIKGEKNAVIHGDGRGRIIEINHDYYHLEGFTIDGLAGDSNNKNAYRDKLLYVQGTEPENGVEGLKILTMQFKNAGGECLRLRYFAKNNEIAYSRFENCGIYDFKFNDGGKNGEAIYLGTSSNQWADGKNPTTGPDVSSNNWIHHNYFDTQGNECVDIKEGATKNIVEYNSCTGQKDPNSAGLDSRGDGNIFRYNEVYNNLGAGVRLGGHTIDNHAYGAHNDVYENKLYENAGGGIKIMVSEQGTICGNEFKNEKNFVGSAGSLFSEKACDSSLNPDSQSPVPPKPQTPSTPSSEKKQDSETNPITTSSNDSNGPENAFDKNLKTRWSAEGDNQWIAYDLGEIKKIKYLNIGFYRGDKRKQYFDIALSSDNKQWETVYSGKSRGKTTKPQKFDFKDTQARYVKIIGHKNSENNWNSFTEIEIII